MKILSKLKDFALKNNIILEEHYKSLHKSPFYKKSINLKLRNSEIYEKRLIRLPIYPSLRHDQLSKIVNTIKKFVKQNYK
jgi:dTDP-4-amino-4,6-dideoxygalactose transaminase